jgi:hypothetical protein
VIYEYDDVLPAFLGRAKTKKLHVIGRYNHFLRSAVAAMMRQIDVRCCPVADLLTVTPATDNDAYIYWYNKSPGQLIPPRIVQTLAACGKKIINYGRFSQLKSEIENSFERVFGYALRVDPLRYVGEGVVKGDNDNGSHAAEFVTFPLSTKAPGFVYERLVKNELRRSNEEVWTQDYRVFIFDGQIPFVLTKIYPIQRRSNRFAWASRVVSPYEAFSKGEIELLAEFCKDLQIDFCELDVLRDLLSSRIYVVDANTTPFWGWRRLMEQGEIDIILRVLATQAVRSWWRSVD